MPQISHTPLEASHRRKRGTHCLPSHTAPCIPAPDAPQLHLAVNHGITTQGIALLCPHQAARLAALPRMAPVAVEVGAISGACLRAGRISVPQIQESQACYEQRGLRFAQQQGLGAGRAPLVLLGLGEGQSRARCSELTTDSTGEKNDKFAVILG